MTWKAWAMFISGLVVLVPCGIGVYMVLPKLYYLGMVVLVEAGLLPTIGVFILATFAVRYFFQSSQFDIGASGTVDRWFHRTKVYAPMTVVTPKVAGSTTVTDVTPEVPRLAQLIEEGALVKEEEGKMLMFQGFRADESRRYGDWPGVIAITGMQNVGKSITMMMLIIIALLSGAHVVICDTHNTKPRSLYKKVMCLAGLVTFALTEEQVLAETKKFKQELFDRKQGKPLYPYVIFYDEFCSLIRARNDELREVLPETMEEASQEGLGYSLHLVCAIHDMSNSGIGDARLRSFFNWVYCHKMEAGQTKFIDAFKGKYGKLKTQSVIASLPQGHVMTRDEVNEIEYLIIPNGSSKDALLVKDKLQQIGGSTRREIPEISSFKSEIRNFKQGEISDFRDEEADFTLKPEVEISDFSTYDGRKAEVARQRKLGLTTQGELLKLIWNVRPGDTQEYKNARDEYKRILQELAGVTA